MAFLSEAHQIGADLQACRPMARAICMRATPLIACLCILVVTFGLALQLMSPTIEFAPLLPGAIGILLLALGPSAPFTGWDGDGPDDKAALSRFSAEPALELSFKDRRFHDTEPVLLTFCVVQMALVWAACFMLPHTEVFGGMFVGRCLDCSEVSIVR